MAGSFNKVILMGNIVKDPELRYTPQGTAVTDIRMAINDPRAKSGAQGGQGSQGGQQNTATFVDVTLWDRSAEVVCEYLRKGRPILIEGRLVTDTWDDRETGKKMSKLKVVAQSFQFVDGRESADGGAGGGSGGNYGGGGSGGYAGGGNSGGGNYGGGAPRGGRGQEGGSNRPQQSRPSTDDDFGGFPADNAGGDDIPF